jgi:hypothetical protein
MDEAVMMLPQVIALDRRAAHHKAHRPTDERANPNYARRALWVGTLHCLTGSLLVTFLDLTRQIADN